MYRYLMGQNSAYCLWRKKHRVRVKIWLKHQNIGQKEFYALSAVNQTEKEKHHISSVTQSCRTLCDPMNCSTPGFPVLHYLPELAQTHVHQIGDVIQPSCPLSSPSPPAFNLSQHQGLFQ